MTDKQWDILINVINGEKIEPLPVGFIIDSPWLPNWFGIPILDYFSNDNLWFDANIKAINEFPEVIFLPGFWSEYGMCTEPSAFGAKCSFPVNAFPNAEKVIDSAGEIVYLEIPDPSKDGLLPFMLNRLKHAKAKIEDAGHKIRFSVSRGPLNIACFLMGMTEFLISIKTEPEKAHYLLKKITTFLKKWHQIQKDAFPSIDGILLLDDIIGFIGEEDFKTFGLPYFKELYETDMTVKFLHNDASCKESIKYLPLMGVNLFNMAFDTDLNELKRATNNKVTMLGNIPPRDVLARGGPDEVKESVEKLMNSLEDKTRVILSCGGGMPPDVSSENIKAFIETVKAHKL
ncbi:uroporphyrinogen decarboxylase family protein [candidate division WOR-3 bacterium]|nr:uroporphyrinogen decarboxylase family protein [candidate division WOR-3 bacterium]